MNIDLRYGIVELAVYIFICFRAKYTLPLIVASCIEVFYFMFFTSAFFQIIIKLK